MTKFTVLVVVLFGALSLVARCAGYDTQPEGPDAESLQASGDGAAVAPGQEKDSIPGGKMSLWAGIDEPIMANRNADFPLSRRLIHHTAAEIRADRIAHRAAGLTGAEPRCGEEDPRPRRHGRGEVDF